MVDEDKIDVRALLVAGFWVGILGGTLTGLVAMIHSATVGLGFWLPMKTVAAVFLNVDALIGGAGTIVLGVAVHMLTAIVWGCMFSFLVRRELSTASSVVGGLVFGVLVWAIMTYGLLPSINQVMFEWVSAASGWFFFYHLLFGVIVGVSPVIARRSHRKTVKREREIELPRAA